jgi:hypothetical protein
MGAMAYELESFEVEGVDVAAVLAWAEAMHWFTVTVLPGWSGLAGTDPTMA